jgi:DNA-binding transcriptional LysR family regulator
MATIEPNWEHYRTFLDVMRDGSLSGAARRLGLTQPTAGRHIDTLETALGLALFTRSQRGLMPTAAAHDLLPHVEAMASSHAALLRSASAESSEVRGTVRLTASEIMGTEVLPPLLAGFCAAQRGIVLELSVSNRSQDMLRRDADVAIRMHKPQQDALVAKRIGSLRIGLFAHRAYLRQFGTPASLSDLSAHRLIGFDRDIHSYRSIGAEASAISRDQFGFRSDNDIAQLAALRAGIGIGACQLSIAARSADLVAVLPRAISFKLEMWLVMHENLRATRRVKLVFDHLAEQLSTYVRAQPKT